MKYSSLSFLLLLIVTIFSSCASRNYYSSDRTRNNSFTIVSNTPNLKVTYKHESLQKKKGQIFSNLHWYADANGKYTCNITFDKLRRRGRKLIIQKENFESEKIKIKRIIRPRQVIRENADDVKRAGNFYWVLAPIPFFIDLFRPDFYKIRKRSKNIVLNLKYTNDYMNKKYFEIENTDTLSSFISYIKTFPYSKQLTKAENKRDSLELIIAIDKAAEIAIDDYISTHMKSKFLKEAKIIKKEVTIAREEFEIAKSKHSIEAYEEYLSKYPRSLQKKDAINKLVDVAFKQAISQNKLEASLTYNANYLLKYTLNLNPDTVTSKQQRLTKNIDRLIIKEYDKDDKNKYNSYANLWKKYRQVAKTNRNLKRLEQCETYINKISDFLLSELSKQTDAVKQQSYLSHANNDFKDFVIFNEYNDEYKDTIIPLSSNLIDNAEIFSGTLKLFNQKYISNRIRTTGEGDMSRWFIYFNFKGQEYSNYEEANYEEITLKDGRFSNITLYKDKSLLINYKYAGKSNIECSYYLNGKLARTDFQEKNISYFYEYENGINLTLKSLEDKIKEADYELTNKNYDYAIEQYKNCYKNDYPKTIALNLRIEKSILNAEIQKTAYQNKLEQERIAEEKKQEKIRLAEEKKQELIRIAEEIANEKARKAEENNYTELTEADFSDYAGQMKGKIIVVPAVYNDASQAGPWSISQNMTLRYVGGNTEINNNYYYYSNLPAGYDSQNYYRRIVRIDGNKVYLIIPNSLSQNMPNSSSVRIWVKGKLINSNTLEVRDIQRYY